MTKFKFKNLKKPLLIAEIGNNHEGSFKRAKKLIDLAKEAGADAVKFQTIKPRFYYHEKEKKQLKNTKSLNLPNFNLKSYQFTQDKKTFIYINTI